MTAIRDMQRILWICGRPWKVEFCTGHLVDGDTVPCGMTYRREMRIRISGDSKMSRTVQRGTLLHEVFHACLNGIANGKDLEESMVESLELTFYDCIRDARNAWFLSFLLEPEETLVPFFRSWENMIE